jgi:hypothetical protein
VRIIESWSNFRDKWLIEDWTKLRRAWSVQAAGLAASIQGTWTIIPDWAKAELPPFAPKLIAYTVTALIVAIPVLRALDQTPKDESK